MASRYRRWHLAAALGLGAAVAACADPIAEPPAEFVAVRRAWAPGERAALISRIMTNHEYVFPYVGDISAMAPMLYADSESVTVLVANPALAASVTAPLAGGGAGLSMFNAAWNFVALKLTVVDNTNAPPDTLFWHLAVWADPIVGTNHGFAIAFSRATTFNIRPINSTNFDAAFGTAGAAAGEFHLGTGTLWLDDAGGGRYQVTSQVYPGAFATVTTGPFLGGQQRAGTAFGRVANSNFVRSTGAEAPANFTVSFDYRVTPLNATEIVCVFPSPCTTNVPGLVAALRRGALPDSLAARVPWLAARRAR